MTASGANISREDVIVAVGAANEKIIVSDIPDFALVVGPAPAVLLASGCAPIPLPIAVSATADGIEFVQVQFLVFPGAMVFDFFPNPVGIELMVAFQEAFDLFAAIGFIEPFFQTVV